MKEGSTSEQSARMSAMDNASKNAGKFKTSTTPHLYELEFISFEI